MATSQFLDDFMHTDVDEKAKSELVRKLESQLASTTNSESNLVQNQTSPNQFQTVIKPENNGQQQLTVINGLNGPSDVNKQNLVFTSISGTLSSTVLSQNSPVLVNSRMPGVVTVTNNLDGTGLKSQLIQQVVNQNGPVSIAGQQLTLSQSAGVANMVSSPISIQQGGIAMIRPGTSGTVTVPTQQTVINQSGMLPAGMQVLNVRPGTAGPVQIAQRQLAPRVLLAPQQVITSGARPGVSGIPISALQGLPGAQGQHLLLKTESGQYQLVRVNHAPQQGQTTQQTIQAAPQVTTQNVVVQSTGNQANAAQQPAVARSQPNQAGAAGVGGPPMTPETAKLKCKNFLATLLKLSNEQAEGVSKNVATLIQALIDGRIEPEEFTQRLQKELNSSEQPCLAPFLRKTLPYLRYSLATGDIKIDGLVPPPLSSVPAPPPVVPASPMLRLGPTTAVANTPIMRPVQQTQVQRPQGTVTLRPPVVAQGNVGLPAGSPRPQQPQNRMAAPKSMTPNRNLKAPNQLKNNIKGADSPLSSSGSFAQKNIIAKEKKFSSSLSSSVGLSGDDDINDVATMGGVNLAEESQRIMGPTELIGTQIRSVKDETFFPPISLQRKVQEIMTRHHGLEEISPDFISLLSHAAQERLKNILERLSIVTEHKMDIIKNEGDYEASQDVKGQIRFLEDLDKVERKRHDENERERLMKAAKSRSRTEDPEQQAKLKAKAKEMQRVEMEEMRQAEANRTALQAIGQRKKFKLDTNPSGVSQMPYRPRLKRPTVREMLFILEEEKDTCKSPLLYKAFVK